MALVCAARCYDHQGGYDEVEGGGDDSVVVGLGQSVLILGLYPEHGRRPYSDKGDEHYRCNVPTHNRDGLRDGKF